MARKAKLPGQCRILRSSAFFQRLDGTSTLSRSLAAARQPLDSDRCALFRDRDRYGHLVDFVLNGRAYSLDAKTVRARVPAVPPHDIRVHWVEIDGRRWPPKQAFRIALDLSDEPFISHTALRIFQRLGFNTSVIPGAERHPATALEPSAPDSPLDRAQPSADALSAFALLDDFLARESLTAAIATLEARLNGADQAAASTILDSSGLDEDLIDSALIVRERIGMIDTLIHAAVITLVLPHILEPGETLTKRPSLGAGNDAERTYDLETTHRVAEFKLSSWKGHDGMRQRGLFADVVGLAMDTTGRRRQMYVVGELPVGFLTGSGRNTAKTLQGGAAGARC